MVRSLNHSEVIDLLGAFALDAVDNDEREAIERHLADCAQCRREVSEHREVAGLLASGWVPAPEGLWDRIASSLEETPPPLQMPASPVVAPPPIVSLDDERRRRPRRSGHAGRAGGRGGGMGRAVAAVGIAASVAVVGVFAGLALTGDDGPDDVADVAAAAAARPDARKVAMRSPDGAVAAEAVVLPDGTGYLLETNLPELPPDRTYQLWAVVGTNKISVGVLGRRVGPLAFHAAADLAALAITNETAGGVIVSQQQPTALGTLN